MKKNLIAMLTDWGANYESGSQRRPSKEVTLNLKMGWPEGTSNIYRQQVVSLCFSSLALFEFKLHNLSKEIHV